MVAAWLSSVTYTINRVFQLHQPCSIMSRRAEGIKNKINFGDSNAAQPFYPSANLQNHPIQKRPAPLSQFRMDGTSGFEDPLKRPSRLIFSSQSFPDGECCIDVPPPPQTIIEPRWR